MRMVLVFFTAVVVLSACSTATEDSGVPAESTTVRIVPEEVSMPPQIADFRVKHVTVGDRELTLAIADDPSLRRQGLQGVADLEDLDGMLFFWRHDGDAFWMKDTLIPLDIVWFNEDGSYKDRASMVPCPDDNCESYEPVSGLDFRYAIEAAPGTLDWITPDTLIVYIDD